MAGRGGGGGGGASPSEFFKIRIQILNKKIICFWVGVGGWGWASWAEA